jgi:hypothetical protein
MRFFILYIFFLFSLNITAQWKKWLIPPPYNIKSVWLDNHKRPFFSNIIEINSSFTLSFDDLEADEKDYYYKIIRLDEKGNISGLQVSEFIDGFDTDLITDMEQSTGTLQSYVHYKVDFPNENTRFLLSGNYLIQILDEDENVLFSKGFVLYEKKIDAGIQIKWPEDVSIQKQKQQIDIFLYPGSLNIQNVDENLSLVLIKNNNWQDLRTFHSPTYYQGAKWIYHYPDYSVFDGVNEYRRFETKDIRGMNYNIVKKGREGNLYDFYIYPDTPRTRYSYYKDTDGCFYFISVQSTENVHIEADYTYVHFSYKAKLLPDEKIYVVGKFNDYLTAEDYELKYNPETMQYENQVLLKQGYYEYLYLIDNHGEKSFIPAEGNFAETENIYELLIYYKAPGQRYTGVIGYSSNHSIKMQ